MRLGVSCLGSGLPLYLAWAGTPRALGKGVLLSPPHRSWDTDFPRASLYPKANTLPTPALSPAPIFFADRTPQTFLPSPSCSPGWICVVCRH